MPTEEDQKPFPIQGGSLIRGKGWTKVSYIPWWLAKVAYEEYQRRYPNLQSLETLTERGGFGREELLDLLKGKRGKDIAAK